jgi:hypothetical protein
MGIYTDNIVYGIGWSIYDISKNDTIYEFSKTVDLSDNKHIILSNQDIQDIKIEYENYIERFQNNINTNNYRLSYTIFTKCSSTNGEGLNDIVFMKWLPVSKEFIYKLFTI